SVGHQRAARLFSRRGERHVGSPNAASCTVPSVASPGAISVGGTTAVQATFNQLGGMCPRCEGRGSVTDIDLTQLYDEEKSLAEGAITVPGYAPDGWYVKLFSESGFLDPHK